MIMKAYALKAQMGASSLGNGADTISASALRFFVNGDVENNADTVATSTLGFLVEGDVRDGAYTVSTSTLGLLLGGDVDIVGRGDERRDEREGVHCVSR